jgi:hypothetical protein
MNEAKLLFSILLTDKLRYPFVCFLLRLLNRLSELVVEAELTQNNQSSRTVQEDPVVKEMKKNSALETAFKHNCVNLSESNGEVGLVQEGLKIRNGTNDFDSSFFVLGLSAHFMLYVTEN